MPDPATQFQQAGLQAGQYWPVETHLPNVMTLQPVQYGAITDALTNASKLIANSPLNPMVRAQRDVALAQAKTQESEQGLNQTVIQDILAHPENYQGLLGYKGGQGAEVLATGALGNNWAAQNAGGGYGYRKPPPPAKTDDGGGGDQQKKTADQTQGGDANELAAAQAYFKAHGLDPSQTTYDRNTGFYSNGSQTIDGPTARAFAGGQNTNNVQTQGGGNQRSDVAAGSGTTQLPQSNTTTGGNQSGNQGQASQVDPTILKNEYEQRYGAGRVGRVQQQGNFATFYDKNGQSLGTFPLSDFGQNTGSTYHAGGLVTSPFRPMSMAAPPPAPMFMQAGGPVPGGQGPGAMPPGGAPQAPVGAIPPQQMQQWQNATQGNTASAKAALEWAQNNMDTAIKRAVLMRGGGPGGQDAYAFFGPKGGSNIVPVMQMMAHGFAPEIIAQNTTSHLSAAPQPATPPPAAPQGQAPIRMADGGVVPDNNANANASPNLPASPTNPGGFSVQGPLTGDQLATLMNTPGAVTDVGKDVANPTIRQFQAEANRTKTPVDSTGNAAFHNAPDEVNITGKDGMVGASGGEINSPLMARYLHTLILNGDISNLPKADNGDPIIKTLRNGTVIRADMSHNNGTGQASGAPYISYSQDPYHDVRLYAGMDHTVLHQNTDQELAQNVAAITHLPADEIAAMSREAKLDILYSKYRQENLPNLPPDVEKNFNDFHSILQYGARSQDVVHNMLPGEYDLAMSRFNELKNVAGNPLLQAWKTVTNPFHVFGPSGQQATDLTTIDQNWTKLQQSDAAMRAYISGKANIDGTDKEYLLKSLGDPAFNNVDYPLRIQQFMKDQITNYQIAVRKAEAQGYYVPQIFKDDMMHIDHFGRVLDPQWSAVTPTTKAEAVLAKGGKTAGEGAQPQEGTFPQVNWSKNPPQGIGHDKDHAWNLDNMSEAQRQYAYSNAARGTWVSVGGKPVQLQ